MFNPIALGARLRRHLYRAIMVRIAPITFFRSIGVRIGQNCRIERPAMHMFGSEPYLIRIGDNVLIGHACDFITHDGGVRQFRKIAPDIDVMGTIVIGDNVVIGAHAILLAGTNIGSGSVITPCSVVKGTFEPNRVISGHPARAIATVERYWEQVQNKVMPTAALQPDEKRDYLEAHFANTRQTT